MPSLGRDLQTIREHLDYTIEDIQSATKLPLDTIRSIEDGTIFSESKEINTYIRSFVRTYGRSVKIDSELMAQALDQEELGNYTNLLLNQFPELSDIEPAESSSDRDMKDDETTSSGNKKRKKRSPSFMFAGNDDTDSDSDKSTRPKATRAKSTSKKPDVHSIDWAGLGQGFKKKRSQPPVWMISIGLLIIILIAAAIIISQFGFFSSEDDTPVEPPVANIQEPANDQDLTLNLSEDVPERVAEDTEVALSDTLYLTIYAASGRLDPVRVWSDLKPRIDPYWIEQGVALNFEFADSIRIAGSYSNMLLFMNGNRIDNFRGRFFNPEESRVELTRAIFDSDPQWATPSPFELPEGIIEPDTVMIRPSFP